MTQGVIAPPLRQPTICLFVIQASVMTPGAAHDEGTGTIGVAVGWRLLSVAWRGTVAVGRAVAPPLAPQAASSRRRGQTMSARERSG